MKPILDYSKSWMTEGMVENIDGFLLGDGCIRHRDRPNTNASATLKYEEFGNYLAKVFYDYGSSVTKRVSPAHYSSKAGYFKECKAVALSTKSHPDLQKQRNRWYPNGIKEVPDDVRITPSSLLLWYLGDGSLFLDKGISPYVTFYTNSFSKTSIDILQNRFNDLNMTHWHLPNNTIRLKTPAVKILFDMIGRSSPIECYSYKFDVPDHLWKTRSSDVQKQLGLNKHTFHRLMKKSGMRSEMGERCKFFHFSDEQIDRLRSVM